jgi:hypothetical protein
MAGMTESNNILWIIFSALCLGNDMMAFEVVLGVANKALIRFKPQIAMFSVHSGPIAFQVPIMIAFTVTPATFIALWRILSYLLPC